jgi:hypothetical protein
MRRLLTGYAGAFNRRHSRTGHLVQNRYKSVVVEEAPYLLELVRYLHLNPLRAGRVPDLPTLARYPWTGHSALLGTVARPWQATADALGRFARRAGPARTAYRAFVAAGLPQGRRPEPPRRSLALPAPRAYLDASPRDPRRPRRPPAVGGLRGLG